MGGTGLGGLAAYLFRRGTDRTVSVLLSFAAGMMLAVVCADLLTDAIQAGPGLSALPAASASVLAGCGGIWLLEELVSGLQAGAKRGGLFLAGVVMAGAIALHNLPEGMVIGASYAADLAEAGQDGRMMALVIGLHNIPEGMAVAVPLAAGGASRGRAVLTAAAAGAPTVLGAVLGFCLGTMGPGLQMLTLGGASGAMLYVVFGELLPESFRHICNSFFRKRQSVDQRLFHTFFLCCLQIFLILGKDQLLLHDQLVCHCAKSFIFLRCSQFCRCDSRMFCMVCKHFHI